VTIEKPSATKDQDPTEVIDITVKRDTGVELTFADGMVARFALADVRRHCPCATCRSLRDKGEDAWPRPNSPMPLAIVDARLHGAWGLDIDWNDGHGSGIFPFEEFRRWAEGHDAFRGGTTSIRSFGDGVI